MAARRLILVMLVLLVLSSAVAALIPVERRATDSSTTSTTTTTQAAPPPSGRLLHRRIDAGAKRPATLRLDRGDQLDLTVTASQPAQVEIVALGQLEDVDRFLPARFDLLPVDPGTYAVRLLPTASPAAPGRVIGRIVVAGGKAPA